MEELMENIIEFGLSIPFDRYKKTEVKNLNLDYCPKCHKRREHIKSSGIKMCKTCGYQERVNI